MSRCAWNRGDMSGKSWAVRQGQKPTYSARVMEGGSLFCTEDRELALARVTSKSHADTPEAGVQCEPSTEDVGRAWS